MLRGSELEGYKEYPCGAAKIHYIRKDQVYKPKLRSIINNSVASEIRSSHYYSLIVLIVI